MKLARKYADDNVKFKYLPFIGNRILKIYLPYVVWVVAYYFYGVHRGWIDLDWTALPMHILTGDIEDHLYFVVVMMQFYLIFPLFLRLHKQTTPRLGIILALPITILARMWFDTGGIFLSHLMFFAAGCYAGAFYKEFVRGLRKFKGLLYPAYIVFAAAHLFMLYQDITGNFNYAHRETMTVIFCILSILVFYHICLCLNKSPKKLLRGGVLSRNLSMSSYYVYLAHVLVLFETERQLYIRGVDAAQWYWIMLAAGIIVPFAASMPYVKIKQILKS